MLHIEQKILQAIVTQVETDQEESCGFVFGRELGENRTITKSFAVANISLVNKQTSFEISSKDYLKAESIASNENLALLGIYHSHPNGSSFPSEQDRLAAQPNLSYIIISVIQKRFAGLRSWQLNPEEEFKEEKILYIKS
jgi:proteasome lid subunit RPN8/RPN11